jgi:hypothetical protein
VRIRGRLSAGPQLPIAGAKVCVGVRKAFHEARLVRRKSVTTNERGRFTYRASTGPSRMIRLGYRSDAGQVVSARVRLHVRASLALRAKPRRLRNGERVRLRGKLRSTPVTRRGALVEVQARRPHRWQTFTTTRSDRRGRFKTSYRFTRTVGLQTYRLRALVPRQPLYPYAPGSSRPVRVTVRG